MITGTLACIYSTVQYGGYIASGRDEMGEVDGSGRGAGAIGGMRQRKG